MSKDDFIFLMGIVTKFYVDTPSVLNKQTALRLLQQLDMERKKYEQA